MSGPRKMAGDAHPRAGHERAGAICYADPVEATVAT